MSRFWQHDQMGYLLLQVSDNVHRKLADRAARVDIGVDAVAVELLGMATFTGEDDRKTRLRIRAAALGVLRETPAPAISEATRAEILASTKGMGQVIDNLLAEDRGRW